ncbi:MAG: V-type ATP synthase subunit F [Acutalibacteraceae bacterium]
MYKIAVIGERKSVIGFTSIGMEVFPVGDARQGGETLDRLVEEEYAVIYITEALASELREKIAKLRDRALPAVILIPGVEGNTGDGMSSVLSCVERAVGSQLID